MAFAGLLRVVCAQVLGEPNSSGKAAHPGRFSSKLVKDRLDELVASYCITLDTDVGTTAGAVDRARAATR